MAMIRLLRAPARRISSASRKRKLDALQSWIAPGSTVLVIGASDAPGVGTQSYVEQGIARHANVVALTYEPVDRAIFGLPTVRADGRRLPFIDNAFDYVISNAVIEHLGGPAGAAELLRESERVAKVGWAHTTPNRRFPFELHTGVPVLHWLPRRLRERSFRAVGKPFPMSHYFLFTGRRLRQLGTPCAVARASGLIPAMTLFVTSPKLMTASPGSSDGEASVAP